MLMMALALMQRILEAVSNNNGKEFQLLHAVFKEASNLKVLSIPASALHLP